MAQLCTKMSDKRGCNYSSGWSYTARSVKNQKILKKKILLMKIKSIVSVAAVLCGLHTGVSHASIAGVTPSMVNNGQLSSGMNLDLNQMVSGTQIRAYHESQVTLASGLAVDRIGSGFTLAGTIASGTAVDSYLLHMDGTGSGAFSLGGTITFSTPILGLIFSDGLLNSSDSVVGVAGVTYYTAGSRGLELPGDLWSVTGSSLTFNGDWDVSTVMDEVRIITAVAPVPEPSTYLAGALLALVFGVQGVRSLRNRKTA